MNPTGKEPFDKLPAINSMLPLAVGSDTEKADQIRAAIRFCQFQAVQCGQPAPGSTLEEITRAYREAVDSLVKFHISDPDSFGFRHWNLSAHPYDPLWVRAHVIRELKLLAGYRQALFLVTGLRRALCPEGKYWTRDRARRYREALDYIESLALQFKTPSTRLSVLFV